MTTRYAVIDATGIVVNHAEADAEFASKMGWVPAADSKIGDKWDGKTFTPPPPPPPAVPESVPMAEARLVLHEEGFLLAIEKMVAAAGKEAQILFEFRPRIGRDHPLVLAAIAKKIFSAQKADEMFIAAAQKAGEL